MSSYGAKTVVLKGEGIRHEFLAAGTITPGMMIEITSVGKVQAHSTASGPATKLFAVENDTIGNDIADDYSAGQNVQAVGACSGMVVYAMLADGQNVAIGAKLESNGAGALQAYVAATADIYTNALVGFAMDAVDASGSEAAAARRIRVMIA